MTISSRVTRYIQGLPFGQSPRAPFSTTSFGTGLICADDENASTDIPRIRMSFDKVLIMIPPSLFIYSLEVTRCGRDYKNRTASSATTNSRRKYTDSH